MYCFIYVSIKTGKIEKGANPHQESLPSYGMKRNFYIVLNPNFMPKRMIIRQHT